MFAHANAEADVAEGDGLAALDGYVAEFDKGSGRHEISIASALSREGLRSFSTTPPQHVVHILRKALHPVLLLLYFYLNPG